MRVQPEQGALKGGGQLPQYVDTPAQEIFRCRQEAGQVRDGAGSMQASRRIFDTVDAGARPSSPGDGFLVDEPADVLDHQE
jgi:hypothetical protein